MSFSNSSANINAILLAAERGNVAKVERMLAQGMSVDTAYGVLLSIYARVCPEKRFVRL